jgi:radical SAM protein with 4Fe4S-binding SPASM domain
MLLATFCGTAIKPLPNMPTKPSARPLPRCGTQIKTIRYFFGNIFREPDLTRMLKTSRARRDFVERPKRLVEDEDCLSCRYLSICHGGCPVRTYSARGTMMAKDPYCEVYKVVFARAESHTREILRRRLATDPERSATARDRVR